MGRRVLVTGANGFIGSHLVEALKQRGDIPIGMVRSTSSLANLEGLDIELRHGSLEDVESMTRALAGVDLVFHVGGRTAAFDQETLNRVNGQGTARLLQAAQLADPGPARVVYVSSLEAAGPSSDNAPRTESMVPVPCTRYGRSKLEGERAAWAARTEREVVVVRPPLVYGPRDQDVLQMIQSSNWRVVARPGFHDSWLSAIHVHDLVHGLLLAGDRGVALPRDGTGHPLSGGEGDLSAPGVGIYYFDDGGRHTIASFGHEAARALGKRAFTISIPKPIAWLVALLSEWVGRLRGSCPAYNLDKVAAGFSSGWWCNSEKARRELGWLPSLPLADGLEQTIAWLREQKVL